MKSKKTKYKPIFTLCLLLLIFVGPFVGARILYANKADLEKSKTTNRGQLINPPFSITKLTLYNATGQKIDNLHNRYKPETPPNAKRTNGKWMMVLLYPNQCDKQCQKHLYYLRQIRLATGKDRNRIERAIITNQNSSHPKLVKLLKEPFAGTRLLKTNEQQTQRTLSNAIKIPYAAKAGTIYIVDPFGNLVLAYKKNGNPSNILKDLKRLLRASKIG